MHRSAAAVSRRAVTTAIVCAILLGVIYVLAVWTADGQRFEDAVLAGAAGAGGHGDTAGGAVHAIAVWSLRTVSTPTLVVCTAVVIVIGFLRRRALLGLLGGGVVAASVVTAEVVRRAAFRPVLLEHGVRRADQSFPSGHTATAMSVMFGLILVMPPRFRTYATVIAAPWALATTVATVAIGWHRPSDTAGSEVIVLSYTCLAIAILARRTPPGGGIGVIGGSDRNAVPAVVGAYVLIAAVAAGVMYFGDRTSASTPSLAAYVTGQLIVLGSGATVTAVLLRLLRGVDLAGPAYLGQPESVTPSTDASTKAPSGDSR